MGSGVVIARSPIAWGVAARARPGQACSGDLHLVKPVDGGVLLAVVDGLGHGEEAKVAAKTAVGVVDRYAGESLVSLVKRCHGALTKTRGVVMTLASLDVLARTLTWLGVGNIEGLLLRADPRPRPWGAERAVLRSGLVGYRLPDLRASVVPIAPGDLLVFVTDGINAGFAEGWLRSDPPQEVADKIMARYAKQTDDALVLVARYLGEGHE